MAKSGPLSRTLYCICKSPIGTFGHVPKTGLMINLDLNRSKEKRKKKKKQSRSASAKKMQGGSLVVVVLDPWRERRLSLAPGQSYVFPCSFPRAASFRLMHQVLYDYEYKYSTL